MTRNILILLLLTALLFFSRESFSQSCDAIGQRPSTSIRICNTSVITQNDLPKCTYRVIKSPCTLVTGRNPVWYQFTCFVPGTLGFTISPFIPQDDYDWQLYDVTGHLDNNNVIKEDDVYNDLSLFVACNWSANPGPTGASAAGTGLQNCDGDIVPGFSSMPMLVEGHEYLLLVSHFTVLQNGFSLLFNGGTAGITDESAPHVESASVSCDGRRLSISLSKKMKLNSLSPDGSEFSIASPTVKVISAKAIGNNANPSMADSIELILNNPLPGGNYAVTINNGADGNTLSDNCDITIPGGESIPIINKAIADFETTDRVCPGQAVKLKDQSVGGITAWQWDFGNGKTSTLQSPPDQTYPLVTAAQEYIVTLIVSDSGGCSDKLTKIIKVSDNCNIAVPSGFTPNNDGLNDYLCPLNIYKAADFRFSVYNNVGQLVFETTDYNRKWDGSFKGQGQNPGTYIWVLQYTDKNTGKKLLLKGNTILIR